MPSYSGNYSAILAFLSGGASTLAAVLAAGNTTGGNDIVISSGDAIDAANNGGGPGFNFLITGSDGGGGSFAGGDIIITPGQGSGGGADGEVNINGDSTVQGDLTVVGVLNVDNLRQGTGSPEGVVTATIGTIWQRTDGGAGNAWYIKCASSGGNTGWAPGGPRVLEEFTAAGSAIFTTGRPFFTSVSLSISLFVTWNGIRQREGAANDYQITGASQITFNATPLSGDIIGIEYLPS